MIAKRISGATKVLGPPEGWDADKDGACTKLAVRIVNDGEADIFQSAWEPTPDELAKLNAGGVVILSVYGAQLPVVLAVEMQGVQP